MPATLFKWLLIVCIAVAFSGRPWLQAYAAPSKHGCGSVVLQMADAAAHDIEQSDSTLAVDQNSGHAPGGSCVKACAAMPLLAPPVFVMAHAVLPQPQPSAAAERLNGHPARPELAPPIV